MDDRGAADDHANIDRRLDLVRNVDGAAIEGRLREARLRAFLASADSASGELEDGELSRLVARAAAVYANALTEGTRLSYVRRWTLFESWCESRGLESLPTTPETLMLYLADAVGDRVVALSTMRGWAAAIARVNLEAGLASPTRDPAVTLFLRGLSRMAPAREPAEPMTALRIAPLRTICRAIDASAVDVKEVRDRAMLALVAAGAAEASVARLRWGDVAVRQKSMIVRPPRVLRDADTAGLTTLRLRAHPDPLLCPVQSMRAWQTLAVDRSSSAPVFTVIRSGVVTEKPIRTKTVRTVRAARLAAFSVHGREVTCAEAIGLLGIYRSVDLRDKAMLLIGFAGAFRRNEVTSLRWSDIISRPELGIVVHLRRSKTDQSGRGVNVGIPLGRSALTCPVTALSEWRARVEHQTGAPKPDDFVFVNVGRSGQITDRPLTPEGLTVMVKRRAADAGLEGKWGGRSLRAGFISTAADLEIPLERVAVQSRHATLDSLARYIRRIDPFRDSVAGRVGL